MPGFLWIGESQVVLELYVRIAKADGTSKLLHVLCASQVVCTTCGTGRLKTETCLDHSERQV